MKTSQLSRNCILLSFYLFLASFPLFATTEMAIVKGKVVNEKNEPVEFATAVLISPLTGEVVKGEVCNDKGEFNISKVAKGVYTLSVSMVGYKKVDSEKVVVDGRLSVIEKSIVLNEQTEMLQAVEVVARKEFVEQAVDKIVINPEASITSASENVYEILRKLPGVSIDNNDNITLKGMQGVRVLIDDKPTYLSAQQLASWLKSMQGKDVDKIEIIENPSARYDAEGNSGIINIKTKHTRAPGFNGTINGGVAYALSNYNAIRVGGATADEAIALSNYNAIRVGGATADEAILVGGAAVPGRLGWNGGINLNMNYGKLNVYGNYSNNHWTGWNSMDAVRRFTGTDLKGASQGISNVGSFAGSGHNYKVGADYYLTKNQVLSLMMRGNYGSNSEEMDNVTRFNDKFGTVDSMLVTLSKGSNRWNNSTWNLNYKWDIDTLGQSLVFDVDYARFHFDGFNNQGGDFYNPNVFNNQGGDYYNPNGFINQEGDFYSPDGMPLINRSMGLANSNKPAHAAPSSYGASFSPARSSSLAAILPSAPGIAAAAPAHDILAITSQGNDIRIFSSRLDHVWPISKKLSLESGLKISSVTTESYIDMDGTMSQNDHFIYEEDIQAAYINAKSQLNKTTLQLGLRLENTFSRGNSVISSQLNDTSYLKLFPSVFVQQQLNDNNSLNFRYSYRIGRPSYHHLNPFKWMIDPYTFNLGNPRLKPQFTHTAGLSHNFRNKLISNLGVNYTTGLFTEIIRQDDASRTVYQTRENLHNSLDLSFSETLQLQPVKWWRLNGTVTGMYKTIRMEETSTDILSKYSLMANMSNNFTLPGMIDLELSGRYMTGQLVSNIITYPRYSVDLGLQRRFFNNNGTLKVAVVDLFNTNSGSAYAKYDNVDIEVKNKWSSRRLNLTFSYRFGKEDFKTRANRSTSSSEEQNRSAK